MAFTGRFTVFYEDYGTPYGWSETLWSLIATDFPTLQMSVNTYIEYRQKLLGTGVLIPEIRMSDDSVSGDSRIVLGPATAVYVVVAPNGDRVSELSMPDCYSFASACPVDTSFQFELHCGTLYRGSLFLGGMPSSQIDQWTLENNFTPGFQDRINAFGNLFTVDAGQFALSVLPKGPDAPTKNITGISFVGGVVTVTVTAHGYSSGNKVRINGVVVRGGRFSCSNLPITVLSADTFSLPTYDRPLPTAYIGGGLVAVLNRTLKRIDSSSYGVVTHRKRGRFFNQRRGRVRTP